VAQVLKPARSSRTRSPQLTGRHNLILYIWARCTSIEAGQVQQDTVTMDYRSALPYTENWEGPMADANARYMSKSPQKTFVVIQWSIATKYITWQFNISPWQYNILLCNDFIFHCNIEEYFVMKYKIMTNEDIRDNTTFYHATI
jgi:hypothetical protein